MAYMSDWEASSIERKMSMTDQRFIDAINNPGPSGTKPILVAAGSSAENPAPGTHWTLDTGIARSLVLVTVSDGRSVTYAYETGSSYTVGLAVWAARRPRPAVSVERAGAQVGGDHYERMGVQSWDVIEASPWLDYWTGTALKYVMRAGRGRASKVEDLRKAAHFIAKAIELEEKA